MPQENRLQRKSSTVLVASQHQPNVTSRPSRQQHGSNQGRPPPCLRRMGELGTAPPLRCPPSVEEPEPSCSTNTTAGHDRQQLRGRAAEPSPQRGRAAEVQHAQPWPHPAPGASSSPRPGPGLPATGKVWGEASPGSQSPPRAAASPAFPPPRLQIPTKATSRTRLFRIPNQRY